MIEVQVEGLEELLERSKKKLLSGPMRRFIERASKLLEREVKASTPVDTGRLRAAITTEVDKAEFPEWARVGTNVTYGRFVEWGRRPGKWPPIAAIEPWARRHDIPAFLVARAIGQRGTIKRFQYKGAEMFAKAEEKSREAIGGFLSQAAREIEGEWTSGT